MMSYLPPDSFRRKRSIYLQERTFSLSARRCWVEIGIQVGGRSRLTASPYAVRPTSPGNGHGLCRLGGGRVAGHVFRRDRFGHRARRGLPSSPNTPTC